MQDHLHLGFQLMGYGLLGVFTVLFVFMGAIKLLTVVFPAKKDEDNNYR